MHADVEDLLRNLQEGTSDECCFDIHNITIGNLVFETQGDTVAMAEPFFVRQLVIQTSYAALMSMKCIRSWQ